MYTYCIITRNDESKESLTADGTLARENHMALHISKALRENKKVLAVTGGFHSLGIYRLLSGGKKKKDCTSTRQKTRAVFLWLIPMRPPTH